MWDSVYPSGSATRMNKPPAEVEAQGIAEGVCAQNNLLISLPDDLLFKILLNLCAQDIYRASLVCRRLYYLTIRSEDFVNLHLQQQTDEYGLFFQYAPTRVYFSPYHAIFVSMKQGRVTVSHYNFADKSRFIRLTSCNGLIPQYNWWEPLSGVHLANLVTGKVLQLPPLPKNAKSMCCCLGYTKASQAYKVVLEYNDTDRGKTRAILTLGVDSLWRHLSTHHCQYLPDSSLSSPLVTEGFIHLIFGKTVMTLNVETEVMTKTRAPVFPEYPRRVINWWYLSTGKSLTLVVEVKYCVFRVWEMVFGDNYNYWREWERKIALGNRNKIKDLFIEPVGWLQQMEVLVFYGCSMKGPSVAFYVVIATGEIGWITSLWKGLAGERYSILGPGKKKEGKVFQRAAKPSWLVKTAGCFVMRLVCDDSFGKKVRTEERCGNCKLMGLLEINELKRGQAPFLRCS
ncbi:Unknown protein [Striga hermonthica]|uniref:F-box domain-containing protein n=1 Tax=Striga hermonthica TaxID=68872 RepID=A0A9N7R122_STRHE|nr:Unknown protein [Striga hermonthica]